MIHLTNPATPHEIIMVYRGGMPLADPEIK